MEQKEEENVSSIVPLSPSARLHQRLYRSHRHQKPATELLKPTLPTSTSILPSLTLAKRPPSPQTLLEPRVPTRRGEQPLVIDWGFSTDVQRKRFNIDHAVSVSPRKTPTFPMPSHLTPLSRPRESLAKHPLPTSKQMEEESKTQTEPHFLAQAVTSLSGVPYQLSPFSFIDKAIASPYVENFVYLTATSPYELRIVEHSNINPIDYYTMSRAGVTHFFAGETSFTPLAQWEREYFLFTRIRKIRFFRLHSLWKGFVQWKSTVKRNKFETARKFLSNELYCLNVNLRPALLEVKQLCCQTAQWSTFPIERHTGCTFSMTALKEATTERQGQNARLMAQLNAALSGIVSEACANDLKKFLVDNGFHSSVAAFSQNGELLSPTSEHPLPVEGAHRKTSHAEKAANRTKCRKLAKFIRLIDYLCIHTLTSLIVDRTADVLTAISRKENTEALAKAPRKKDTLRNSRNIVEHSSALFVVEMELSDSDSAFELLFHPTISAYQDQVATMLNGCITALVTNYERLIHASPFRHYTKAGLDDRLTYLEDENSKSGLEASICGDKNFASLKKEIGNGLDIAFHEAAKYAATFETTRQLFVRNKATDISSYSNSSVEVFCSLIEDYTSQMKFLSAMASHATVGIVLVDTTRLKALFSPSPQQRLIELERLLPIVARESTKTQLVLMKEWNSRLSAIPSSVEEFVSLVTFLAELNAQGEKSDNEYKYVQDLYSLMSESSIRVPDSDKVGFEKLTQVRSQFRASLMLSEAAIQTNKERFVKELESQAPAMMKEVKAITSRLQNPSLASLRADMDQVISQLRTEHASVTELESKIERFTCLEKVLAVKNGAELRAEARTLREDVDFKLKLWTSLQSWKVLTGEWTASRLDAIDADSIEAAVQQYQKVITQARRVLGAEHEVVNELQQRVAAFSETMPIVTNLRSPQLQVRHWDAIEALLKRGIRADPTFSLRHLLECDAMSYKTEIAAIAYQAQQEANLSNQLNNITTIWSLTSFTTIPHRDTKDVYILGSCEDILVELDASFVSINTILSSRFVLPIKEAVDEVNKRLVTMSEVIEEWAAVQRAWMYLEVIFASSDIVRQLPEDFNAFAKVDKQWKELMRRTNDGPNCLASTNSPGLKDSLIACSTSLDRIQKSLEAYLETRRQTFPRFYFLSNDELLLILSQSKDLEAVQPHLSKCFDAISRLDFSDNRDIKAMLSAEGERVNLGANLKARGPTESWLPALEADMVKSLRRYIKRGVADYERQNRVDWITSHHAQTVAVASLIHWAREAEEAIVQVEQPISAALRSFYSKQIAQLKELTEMVRSDLTPIERKKIIALIVTDVHNRDITDQLVEANIGSTSAFLWQQQLRFEWSVDSDDCIVRQAAAEFVYGYEYQGVTSRLVITPLTDRCWMTITGALQLCYGASPQGPAGTGKTESTKDLAKALGQMCIVVNCGEGMNYKTMAKLFSGLAQTGGWTCLDEFNRIDIEVLSVVAQQLLSVRQALMQKSTEFLFDGTTIPLKNTFGVMITMNPGYAGRTELPENLKVLFRPVSMMIPDYALIAEMMLFAEGFDTASSLSKKMVKLYKLCSEQLSQQDHYDFGMRAVKSVLVMAGALKRAQPTISEDVVLIRAMRNANEAKFIAEDLSLFYALVEDLFPGVDCPVDPNTTLEKAVIEVATHKLGLQTPEVFVNKVIQLYDTLQVRFGVMLVGNTGGGKTQCLRTLQTALNLLHSTGNVIPNVSSVQIRTLNPKSISIEELYGSVSSMTQEWSDGLASSIMRDAVNDTSGSHHWVHFDGPVDALWIESMNTVLDDNMTLCLVNGERMKLKNEMRMMFEVADLAVASPATVSRCGMVFMTHSDMGPLPAIYSFINKNFSNAHVNVRAYLHSLFSQHLPAALCFLRSNCKETITTSDSQACASVCSTLEALIRNSEKHLDSLNSANELDWCHVIDLSFVFALCWGLGGALEDEDATKFSAYLCQELPQKMCPDSESNFQSLFDLRINLDTGTWQPWSQIIPSFQYSSSLPYSSLTVPTQATVKYQTIMSMLLNVNRPVYFTGGSGVGKSLIVTDFFNQTASQKRYVMQGIAFSGQSSAKNTQETIEAKLIKYRKNLLGAPSQQKHIVFVDDVNLCGVETFGAQPPIELLRQMIEYEGCYDRSKLFWKTLQNVVFVCAAAPAKGGGRHEMSSRCMRHFSTFAVPQPSRDILTSIFSSILNGFLKPFSPDVAALESTIVQSTVSLYLQVSSNLLPTPEKAHYTFNLRDVSAIVGGILQIKPEHCKTQDVMIKLWLHETERCLADRLVDSSDISWFRSQCSALLKSTFPVNSVSLYDLQDTTQLILFADWLRPGGSKDYVQHIEPPLLENVDSKEELCSESDTNVISFTNNNAFSSRPSALALILNDYLRDYNQAKNTNWSLVFFDSAVSHISRITRILRQPRGHALLVGVGGSGKQTYARLAAFICGVNTTTLSMYRGYSYLDFQSDLRKVLYEAGVRGVDSALLIADHQIINERFLEDINALLNSGEIGNLFVGDDLTQVIEELTPVCRDQGLSTSKESVYSEFVRRTQRRLHIVLCMSPVGDLFRIRCRQFPSLINCTTIDWFNAWSSEALHSVAERHLATADVPEQLKKSLINACVKVHHAAEKECENFKKSLNRAVYTTAKSYLDWLSLYSKLLTERTASLTSTRRHFVTGLTKLKETQQVVAELQETLTALQPVLVTKAKETESLMAALANDTEKADSVRVVVEAEEKTVNEAASEVREIAASAQADLDEAMPPLRAALKALEKLKKAEISEVKSMASPPAGVVKTMEMVCLLLNVTPDWDSAKKLLTNVNFLKDLQTFDKESIDPRTIKKLTKYTVDPELTEERMNQISKAGAALLSWVLAMIEFSKVSKIIGPKKEKLAELNASLSLKEKQLAQKQAQLADVMQSVANLKNKYEATIEEKRALDEKSALTAVRLERAEKLIGGLDGEETRWTKEAASLDQQIVNVTGNVIIAAAAIAYYGSYTSEFRAKLIDQWKSICTTANIPFSIDFSLQSTLGQPYEIKQWLSNGLPTDGSSIDSGIVVKRSQRWPLCIDPQEQAKKWIRNEHKSKLVVTRQSAKGLSRQLELAIASGTAMLIEDMGEVLDSVLDPVLAKATYTRGSTTFIRVNDNEVEYHDRFFLYMTTKLGNPHYLPESQIKVTLLNFTVTRSGLEDQLLGEVVRKERPDVEEKRNKLIAAMAKDKKLLSELEEKILHLLSTTEGNLLDSTTLIATLEESKFTSQIIAERVKDNLVTQADIAIIRENYRPVAIRGSLLYFVVSDLQRLDPMYSYSLAYFMRLFSLALSSSIASAVVNERVLSVLETLTKLLFKTVRRGLFERHKLMFAFQMAAQIDMEALKVQPSEWKALLRESALPLSVAEDVRSNPLAANNVLSDAKWKVILGLEKAVLSLSGVVEHMCTHPEAWSKWLGSNSNIASDLPMQFNVSPFARLLLLRAVQPESLNESAAHFVRTQLGEFFVTPSNPSLEEVFVSSDSRTPILFVLSAGADPTSMLMRFANDRQAEISILSLGQGQGERASRMITHACQRGEWLCLANLHLSKSWLETLEEIVENLANDDSICHPNFRLFFTSMPCDYFPVSILQKSIKITNEPPSGLRANLSRSYSSVIDTRVVEWATQMSSSRPDSKSILAFRKLLFSLVFFHAVVQERRWFGPIGFVNHGSSEWNDSDLEASVATLQLMLQQSEHGIPLEALRYVIGEIHYGGRVTDEADRQLLKVILAQSFHEEAAQEEFAYSESGTYRVPADGEHSEYLAYIAQLPEQALPEVFGLHENATLTLKQSLADRLIENLNLAQPSIEFNAAESTGDETAKVIDKNVVVHESTTTRPRLISTLLPELLVRSAGKSSLFTLNKAGVMASLSVVLVQEIERFNRLLRVISRTLKDLDLALQGQIAMSAELDDIQANIDVDRVPKTWEHAAYPSLKPLSLWIKDLRARVEFFRDWLINGEPQQFWLSAFFFPQGFLTAVLQKHAREHTLPIDTLVWQFEVRSDITPGSRSVTVEDGVLINGLFIESAIWCCESNSLQNAIPGELYASLPVIHFKPVTIDDMRSKLPVQSHTLPLYKTTERRGTLSTTGQSTNFILGITLPSELPSEHWTLRGAASIAQLAR